MGERKLREPKGKFQMLVRRLAEEAMSATHHDIDPADMRAAGEIEAMERRFTSILRGYLAGRTRAARNATPAGPAALRDGGGDA